jgi:hypothetical protein
VQVFSSQDYPIIDLSKWKLRDEDKKWQCKILEWLQEYVEYEYIQAQYEKYKEGTFRFKPEEVAVAAALPNPPHGLDVLEQPAKSLISAIIEHNNNLANHSLP